MPEKPYSMKGEVIRLIAQGNPSQRLKTVEFDSMGGVKRVEWYDEDQSSAIENQERSRGAT